MRRVSEGGNDHRDCADTHLVEMLATPFSSVLAGVSIKDSKVSLSTDATKVIDERVRTAKKNSLHVSSRLSLVQRCSGGAKQKSKQEMGCDLLFHGPAALFVLVHAHTHLEPRSSADD